MGGQESKGKVLSSRPLPPMPPEPPYPGPPAHYQFVNTQVMLGTQLSFRSMLSPMVTSNVDSYYPLLAAQYADGYRLLSFYRIPGQQQKQGFFNPKVALEFQGIFCRYPDVPRRANWQLCIEKSVIQMQPMCTGIVPFKRGTVLDTSHMLDSIARNTQGGGRLICIELTGQQEGQTLSNATRGLSPLIGVDLFFEIPDNPAPMQYIYNSVSVPITITVEMGFRPVPHAHCDWNSVLTSNLSQGWRLVEIVMNKPFCTMVQSFAGPLTLNSMWFFEKPASRMNDPTPIYEGTMVEHDISITASFGSTRTSANWEPVMEEMGRKGWELACILETPETRFSSMTTIIVNCKLFFQRPILPQGGAETPLDLPPPSDVAVAWQGQGQRTQPLTGFQSPSPAEKPGD